MGNLSDLKWTMVEDALPGIGRAVIVVSAGGHVSSTRLVIGSNHAPPFPGLYWGTSEVSLADLWIYHPGPGPYDEEEE